MFPSDGLKKYDCDFAAAGLIHSFIRQRLLLYSLTRPFYPGERPASLKAADEYYWEQLKVRDDDRIKTVSDQVAYRLLDALNVLAQKPGKGATAAEAFMMLLEAPLTMFAVDETYQKLTQESVDTEALFVWLSKVPYGIKDVLFTDIVLTEWPIVHKSFGLGDDLPRGVGGKPRIHSHLDDKVKHVNKTVPCSFVDDMAAQFMQMLKLEKSPVTKVGETSKDKQERVVPPESMQIDQQLMGLTMQWVPRLYPSMSKQ